MNKHILPYSNIINESIGRGSVLLIKGQPNKDGRFLYVTTIDGYAEIKPGIKMVFVGNTIYRVVHKGEDKFSGKKVDYNNEDGLRGIFNMKNQGRPSLVLNHNKTPFHWLTLKHLDIGKALREIGTRLFNHELILESNKQFNIDSRAKSFILKEVINLITGRDTVLKLLNVVTNEGGEELSNVEDDDGHISNYETDVELTIVSDEEQVDPQFIDYLDSIGLFQRDIGLGSISDDDKELLGISDDPDGTIFNIRFTTDAYVKHSYDPGDHWTPPSGDSEVTDVTSSLSDDATFSIDGDDDIIITDDIKSDIDIYNKMIEDIDPSDIVSDISGLIDNPKKTNTFSRSSDLNRKLKALYYNHIKALSNLNKNGLSEEAKKKWSKLDIIDIDKLKNQVEEIIKKQNELEEINNDPNKELTHEQVNASKSYFDMINNILPHTGTHHGYKILLTRAPNSKIDLINANLIRNKISELQRAISNPDVKKLELEKELMIINYQKAVDNILGKQHHPNLKNRESKLDFYLNHSK